MNESIQGIVFLWPGATFSEAFSEPRRILRDAVINLERHHVKCQLFLSDLFQN